LPQLTLDSFNGIAPNRTSFSGRALVAENVDLSGGGIKPIKAPSFVEGGHTGEFVLHNGEWVSGDENYISTDIQGIPALIFNRYGGWKINVDGSEGDLWVQAPKNTTALASSLPTPDAFGVFSEGTGNIESGTYEYYASFVQEGALDSSERESKLSAPQTITVSTGRVRVQRPLASGVPSGTKWRVYRRKQGDTYARIVGEASTTQGVIFDDSTEGELGKTIIPENLTDAGIEYRYVVVWYRNLGGWQEESIPSEVIPMSQDSEGVLITLTDTPPAGVEQWRIYRISIGSQPTATFQLVETLNTTTTEYLDIKDNVELGAALGSSYRADNGALVAAGVPEEPFTGMAGPFNGFYVGWIGRDLYLSEPGNPAWWPGAYVVQSNFDISSVTQVGGNLAVVTAGGVQFGYGLAPDSFVLSQSIFSSGGIGRKNADKNFYLAYNGINAVSQDDSELITVGFDKEFFDELDTENSTIIQEKDRVFLFHSTGALVFTFATRQWTTLSAQEYAFTSVYRTGGEVYGLRNGAIMKMFGSDDDSPWIYKAALTFGEPNAKHVEGAYFYGEGTALVEISTIEEENVVDSTGEIDMSSNYEPDRVAYSPAWIHTEAIIYKVSGKSTIRSIMFSLDQVNSES